MIMNKARTSVLLACKELRTSNEISTISKVDITYVRGILREFRDANMVETFRPKNCAANTGYMYKLRHESVLEELTKKHEPRPLMNVLGVWI